VTVVLHSRAKHGLDASLPTLARIAKMNLVPDPIHAIARASGWTCLIALVAGCATGPARAAPSEERRPAPPSESAPRPPAQAAPSASPAAPPPAPEAPGERLGWVNPARCLTSCTYAPSTSLVRIDNQGVADDAGAHQVDRSIQEPLRVLIAAAREAGHSVRIESAFRSYADQARLYRGTKQAGRAARPGHSEHQLGTAGGLPLPTSAASEGASAAA